MTKLYLAIIAVPDNGTFEDFLSQSATDWMDARPSWIEGVRVTESAIVEVSTDHTKRLR